MRKPNEKEQKKTILPVSFPIAITTITTITTTSITNIAHSRRPHFHTREPRTVRITTRGRVEVIIQKLTTVVAPTESVEFQTLIRLQRAADGVGCVVATVAPDVFAGAHFAVEVGVFVIAVLGGRVPLLGG